MDILDYFFSRQIRIHHSDFPVLISKLVLELEVMREQFLFGTVSGLKGENAPLSGISSILIKGCELDSALKAYQLTCIIGFACDYMEFTDWTLFNEELTQKLDVGDGLKIKSYRERYLDCQGNIELLSSILANDIHKIWRNPEPSFKFKQALINAAVGLGIISQATTANVFGDKKTERKLKSNLRI